MGSKAVKSMDFLIFSLPFGLFFWLLAIGEHWKIREKKDSGFGCFVCRKSNGGCNALIVGDTDRTMRPMSRHRMIS